MKKIAVITGGLLPLPATKGGAIETLLQYLIDYNETKKDLHLDIYSIEETKAKEKSKKYKNSNFIYIKISNKINKILNIGQKIIKKLKLKKDPNFQLLYINKVCKKLKEENYDLILIESDNHFVNKISKVTKSPIVLYLHNDKLNDKTYNCKKIYDNCYNVITVSNYISSRVLTINGSSDGKVKTIYNGIDTNRFNVENKNKLKQEMRKQYNLEEDDFIFLFTGRIEKEKGVLELINAFNMLDNPRKKLMILGGSFYSNNKTTKYVREVKNIIANNKNIIVTGYIPAAEIYKYHYMCDVMVSPSQWEEPGSLVNQETFASGIPLLSSYSGGTPEYTKDTKAILINRGEKFVSDLSAAMNELMLDSKKCKEMSESQKKVSKYFSKERYCEDLYNYLYEVSK